MTSAPVLTPVAIARILIATDFSRFSERALRYGIALATRCQASVSLLHVLAPPPPDAEFDLSIPRREAEQHWRDLEQSGRLAGVAHTTVVETGDLATVVARTTDRDHDDLVIVGTHGRGGLRKLVMGSAAEQIFRQSRCPVLTVGPHLPEAPPDPLIGRILFATDYSAASLHALPYALFLAQHEQAQLIMLHVLTEGGYWPSEAAYRALREGREQLQKLLPPDLVLPREPVYIAEYGTAAEHVSYVAQEQDADIIVMGVHGTKALGAATHLPWSVAHRVVHHAHCPVLTVRA